MAEGATPVASAAPVSTPSTSSPGTASPAPSGSPSPSTGSPSPAPPPAGNGAGGGITTEPDKAAPAPPKRYKLKVNGAEQEIEADAIDKAAEALGISPELLLRGSQLHKAGYQAFEEAKKAKAEAEALKARFKAEPDAVLRELAGLDPDQWAAQRVLDQLQRAEMTPEQRELAETKARLEEAEADRKRMLDEQEQNKTKAQREAEGKQLRDRWNKELPELLKKIDFGEGFEGLRPLFVRRMADEMEKQHRSGVQIDPELAAALARDNMLSEVQWTIRQIKDPAKLIRMIGDDAYKALLKHSVDQARGGVVPAPVTPPLVAPDGPQKTLTPDEWRALYR